MATCTFTFSVVVFSCNSVVKLNALCIVIIFIGVVTTVIESLAYRQLHCLELKLRPMRFCVSERAYRGSLSDTRSIFRDLDLKAAMDVNTFIHRDVL